MLTVIAIRRRRRRGYSPQVSQLSATGQLGGSAPYSMRWMPRATGNLLGRLMLSFFTNLFFSVSLLSLTPRLAAQNHVAGLVYESKGAGFTPIPQAHLEAQSAVGKTVGQVQSDAFGHYMLRDLPAGEIVLTVTHSSYYPAREGKHLERKVRCSGDGLCGKVDFELIPNGELEVHVTDVNGQPVDSVLVTVRGLTQPTSSGGWPIIPSRPKWNSSIGREVRLFGSSCRPRGCIVSPDDSRLGVC